MNNFLGSNIKFLRGQKGLSLEKMGQLTGIKGNTISNYENGVTEPKVELLVKLSHFFGCSLDDLIQVDFSKKPGQRAAKGQPMAQKHDRSHQDTNKSSIITVDTSENTLVPILDIKAAAGSPTILDEPDYYRELPTFSFPQNVFHNGSMVGIQVKGHSMTPTVKQGDYVLGKEIQQVDQLRNGEVYIVVCHEDHHANFFVKRCYFYPGESLLVLSSDNDDYQDEEIQSTSVLKLYHVEACLTSQLIRLTPSLRGQFERLEKRIDRIATHVGA